MNALSTTVSKPSDRKLVLRRIFDAPRELLWRAWSDPEHLRQWFKPGDGFKNHSTRADLRVG